MTEKHENQNPDPETESTDKWRSLRRLVARAGVHEITGIVIHLIADWLSRR